MVIRVADIAKEFELNDYLNLSYSKTSGRKICKIILKRIGKIGENIMLSFEGTRYVHPSFVYDFLLRLIKSTPNPYTVILTDIDYSVIVHLETFIRYYWRSRPQEIAFVYYSEERKVEVIADDWWIKNVFYYIRGKGCVTTEDISNRYNISARESLTELNLLVELRIIYSKKEDGIKKYYSYT